MRFMQTLLLILSIPIPAGAGGLCINTAGRPVIETFDSFAGTYESLPTGFSVSKNGSSPMDAEDTDFRGVKSNSVTTGGCYAWNLGEEDHAIGCQPTADDFTPGWFAVEITNGTRTAVGKITVRYDIVCRNNEDRSSAIHLEYSSVSAPFTSAAGTGFTSEAPAELSADWSTNSFTCNISPTNPIQRCGCLNLRWLCEDAGGSGSRDELGINNLSIMLHRPEATSITIR